MSRPFELTNSKDDEELVGRVLEACTDFGFQQMLTFTMSKLHENGFTSGARISAAQTVNFWIESFHWFMVLYTGCFKMNPVCEMEKTWERERRREGDGEGRGELVGGVARVAVLQPASRDPGRNLRPATSDPIDQGLVRVTTPR